MSANTVTAGRPSDPLIWPDSSQRIVVLFGSPHKTGNTARLVSAFLAGIPRRYTVYFYYCYKEAPAPCLDCGICSLGDACALDDLDELMEELKRADVILIATPVYFLSMPAPLKAVVDRTQRFFCGMRAGREQDIAAKQAVVLGSTGSKEEEDPKLLLRQLELVFRLLHAELTYQYFAQGTDESPVLSSQLDFLTQKAAELLRRRESFLP